MHYWLIIMRKCVLCWCILIAFNYMLLDKLPETIWLIGDYADGHRTGDGSRINPKGGCKPNGGDANLFLTSKFPENCIQIKEIGPRDWIHQRWEITKRLVMHFSPQKCNTYSQVTLGIISCLWTQWGPCILCHTCSTLMTYNNPFDSFLSGSNYLHCIFCNVPIPLFRNINILPRHLGVFVEELMIIVLTVLSYARFLLSINTAHDNYEM